MQALIQENNLGIELSWGVWSFINIKKPSTKIFFGIQRPLEWLKIDSNLMNDGFMAKLKSSMEFKKVYDLNTSSETYVQTDEHKYKLTNLRMNSRR